MPQSLSDKNLFSELARHMQVEYDVETSQYTIINDTTPGIFGVGETKQEALTEYLSALGDMILVLMNKKMRLS